MAPADTPGRKKREAQYFEVGVQGRFVDIKDWAHSAGTVAEANLML